MQLSNLSLAARLAGGFAIVIAIGAIQGISGLSLASNLHAQTEEIGGDSMQGVQIAGELNALTADYRVVQLGYVLSTEPAEQERRFKLLAERRQAIEKQQAEYAKLSSDPDERELQAKFSREWKAYTDYEPALVELMRAGKVTEAGALVMGDSVKIYREAGASLDKLVQAHKEGADEARKAAEAAYSRLMTVTISGIAAMILLGLGVAWAVGRSVRREVGGEPSAAAEVAKRVADGDLTVQIRVQDGDQVSLLAALKRMQESLSSIVNGVRQNADSVATASGQISQGNSDLSSRTEEQASALQQTAASMKQLASTVQQNAANAQQGNELANAASQVAVKGGEVVGQVVQTMKGINDSSRKIADIIGVIDGIAFQTNILALNAAVEAARAGEQGRGFAVVAGEVRTLAQRSADAAKEIKGLITASVERVEQGSALVDQAGTTMDEVVSSIRRVTDLMGEISAASREQSAGVAQIGDAVTQMDQATQQNAALVEESAAAADSLKSQAQQLVGAVSVFKLGSAHEASNTGFAAPPATAKVTRPSNVKPVMSRTRPAAAPMPVARTGTDDEWQNF
jgi:methyl-accepting chemotaxis protein